MKSKRVKVTVRPSAMYEDARIVEVTSPDGRSTVTISVGFSDGRWLISRCLDAAHAEVRP